MRKPAAFWGRSTPTMEEWARWAVPNASSEDDVAQGSQALAERVNLGLVRLGLVAVLVLGAALLLDVESQVLEQHDGAVVGLGDNGLDLGADAVRGKGDLVAEQLLELRDDGLQRVLGVDLAVGAAEVGHEDDGLGAVVEGVLDGGDGADDALVVCDLLVFVEGDVEVDLNQDPLALEVDIGDGELASQRHLDGRWRK
ncbi:Uncharacterized protein TPAR_06301 [Tolypocladium paradoxum]|uniref:Uncharacterized protein n=1 Tax=Tolypocladium paradoxum TaxID=94208 RepID=A0A2S4KTJ6_9HYPO|nr:Uncharacterized protein TPAR_06301 [Tolypocladium paradoxum]